MPKAEWGTKRLCASCGARFYDFGRSEVACPSCEAPFDLEQANRIRRTRNGTKPDAVAVTDDKVESQTEDETESEDEEDDEEAVVAADEIDGDITKPDAKGDDVVDNDDDDENEEDQSLIEDASELGDDDDVNDVIEGDIAEGDENN